jgi:hypothetical protein
MLRQRTAESMRFLHWSDKQTPAGPDLHLIPDDDVRRWLAQPSRFHVPPDDVQPRPAVSTSPLACGNAGGAKQLSVAAMPGRIG